MVPMYGMHAYGTNACRAIWQGIRTDACLTMAWKNACLTTEWYQ